MSKEAQFLAFVIDCIKNNKGIAAALRRADNPSTEYQCWEFLVRFGIDLEKPYERLPFALIAAAAVKASVTADGTESIGSALANCYDGGRNNDQAKAKLRRLLACDTVEELCSILRPLLSFIQSKCKKKLNYLQLLKDIRYFQSSGHTIKARWAKNFYGATDERVNDDC